MAGYIFYPMNSWLDALFGGGLAKGGTYRIHGPPGVGKTTLAVQMLTEATAMRGTECGQEPSALVLSGEQPVVPFGAMASRIKPGRAACVLPPVGSFHYFFSRDMDESLGILRVLRPAIVVVDAVQTIGSPEGEDGNDSADLTLKIRRLQRAADEYTTFVFLSHAAAFERQIPPCADFDVDIKLQPWADGKMSTRKLRSGAVEAVEVVTLKNRFGHSETTTLRMTPNGFVVAESV